jgi:penicillin-binding protein 1A
MSRKPNSTDNETAHQPQGSGPSGLHSVFRILRWLVGLAIAGAASLALVIAIALAVAFPNLPDVSALSDYRPILPLRV